MEKFKACEKEMKTKAYSKEGLQQVLQSRLAGNFARDRRPIKVPLAVLPLPKDLLLNKQGQHRPHGRIAGGLAKFHQNLRQVLRSTRHIQRRQDAHQIGEKIEAELRRVKRRAIRFQIEANSKRHGNAKQKRVG